MNIHFPHNMSGAERKVVLAMLALITTDQVTPLGGYVVPGGLGAIRSLLGITQRALGKTIRLLEDGGWCVRLRNDRVILRGAKFSITPYCPSCHRPNASGKWCASCKQQVGRSDRAWQVHALGLLAAGKTPPEIAIAVNRSLLESPDVDDSGRAQGSAVLPYLGSTVPEMLQPEWLATFRRLYTSSGKRKANDSWGAGLDED